MSYRTTKSTRPSWVIVGFIALLAAGCAQVVKKDQASTKRVLWEAIDEIDNRYIEPIPPAKIMMSGLKQLSSLDESVAITRTPHSVILTQDGERVAERPLPTDYNTDEWADVGADMLRNAQHLSPTLFSYNQDELLEAVFGGLVKELDRYSRYETPEEAGISRASREGFGGIGIQIDRVDGNFIVRKSLPDHPAIDAGLRRNDRITHVDGQSIQGLSLNDVIKTLRGRIGAMVKITFVRPGLSQPFNRTIVRDRIIPPTVHVERKGRILEARLTGFNAGTFSTLRRELYNSSRAKGPSLQGLVLDLRGNPGGLLEQAIHVSDLFLTHGRIITITGRHPESNQLFDASPGEVLPGMPMVVVVNGQSASAAEIVAVALRDSGRATIVGSTSFGKGSVQTIIRLPNQGGLNITWARIFAPSGQTLDSQGVVPAICTNVSDKRMAKILAALASRGNYSPVDPAKLRFQAEQPHYSAARRKACMPTDRQKPNDLQAARLLLKNRVSYTAATGRLSPTIAKR